MENVATMGDMEIFTAAFEETFKATRENLLNGPEVFRSTTSKVPLDTWNEFARRLTKLLRTQNEPLSFRRVHHYYLPLLFWLADQARTSESNHPCLVGLCAPQGAGKSTLSKSLVELLPALGVKAANVSIDDFYLTRDEQIALAARYPDNPYLQNRGYPGTHDISLGRETLEKLRSLTNDRRVPCPSYDKSAHAGKGDRRPRAEWPVLQGPLDLVILEGWMLGFRPVAPERLHDEHLLPINSFLDRYRDWTDLLDAFVLLKPLDIRYTVAWRIEAEEKMKARGLPGMSRETVEAYISSFIPAYETYLPSLPSLLIETFGRKHLTLTLDKDRNPHED